MLGEDRLGLGTERARVRTRAGLSEAQKITAGAAVIMLVTALYILFGLWFFDAGFLSMRKERARLEQEVAATEQEAQRLRGVLSEVQRFEAQKAALTQRVALIEQLRRGQTGPRHWRDKPRNVDAYDAKADAIAALAAAGVAVEFAAGLTMTHGNSLKRC